MTGGTAREMVVAAVAEGISRVLRPHPVRVAVDGRTASGKTTLANELAGAVESTGRPVIRTSVDGFHNPRGVRYRLGRMSPEGYYRDARDLAALRRLLLDPLGPRGDRLYRTEAFDLERDEPVDQPARRAPADAVLIVDGTFLQRPELAGCWDYVIFVDVPEAVAIRRGVARDAALIGGEEAATAAHRDRYQRAFTMYETESNPIRSADVVIANDPVEAPKLVRRTA